LSLSRILNKSDDVLAEEFNRAILLELLLDFGAIHIDDDVPEMESAVVISVGALYPRLVCGATWLDPQNEDPFHPELVYRFI